MAKFHSVQHLRSSFVHFIFVRVCVCDFFSCCCSSIYFLPSLSLPHFNVQKNKSFPKEQYQQITLNWTTYESRSKFTWTLWQNVWNVFNHVKKKRERERERKSIFDRFIFDPHVQINDEMRWECWFFASSAVCFVVLFFFLFICLFIFAYFLLSLSQCSPLFNVQFSKFDDIFFRAYCCLIHTLIYLIPNGSYRILYVYIIFSVCHVFITHICGSGAHVPMSHTSAIGYLLRIA